MRQLGFYGGYWQRLFFLEKHLFSVTGGRADEFRGGKNPLINYRLWRGPSARGFCTPPTTTPRVHRHAFALRPFPPPHLKRMETPGAKFVSMIMDRLQALEGETQRQSDKIGALEARALELETQARKPLLASPGIISEQLAFSDGTAIHWALGRPAGMYVTNTLVPLAAPYGDVVIARGPLMLFLVDEARSVWLNVNVASEPGQVTLSQLIGKVNEHLTSTVGHWSELELFLGSTAWQLKPTFYGWQLEVDLDVHGVDIVDE